MDKTGILTLDQIRECIQIFMSESSASTQQNVILMTLLLHQYEALERLEALLITIDDNLHTMSNDSWDDHHNK